MKNLNQNRKNRWLLTALCASFLLQTHTSAFSQDLAKLGLDAANQGCTRLQDQARAHEATAQFDLGRKYEFGIDTRVNLRQAARWYRLAADRGLAKAEYSLGRLYFCGEGVRQNHVEAVKYFRRAALQGYALAKHRLARAYELGLGVPQDLVRAFQWYSLAVDVNGLVSSEVSRKTLAARMTETQIIQARTQSTGVVLANSAKAD